jgi:hypothetical protein
LESDATKAKSIFRHDRLQEPLDLYNQFFSIFADIFGELIDKLPEISAEPVNAELIADVVDGRNAQKAFRYLTRRQSRKTISKLCLMLRLLPRGYAPT